MKNKVFNRVLRGLGFLLIFLISLPGGRLFEIFSWNSSITRIESVFQIIPKDKSRTADYNELNNQYWEKSSAGGSLNLLNLGPCQYVHNRRAEALISLCRHQYYSLKIDIIRRILINPVYADEGPCLL
jgi:hypothetical protein